MARTRNAGPRLVRHAGNVVSMLDGARQVIDSRLSAEAAMTRGAGATALEFGRMVPEKMLAFTQAQAALLQGSAQLVQRMMEYGLQEAAAHQALFQSGATRGPGGWATAQMEWMTGASLRATRFWTQMGAESLAVAERSLQPVRRTVSANRRRLG